MSNSLGVSLIGLDRLSREDLEAISNSGITRLSLTPTNLFPLHADYPDAKQLKAEARRLESFGLQVETFQGIFFGLSGQLSKSHVRRLEWIAEACESLNCHTVTLGSKESRKDLKNWDAMLDTSIRLLQPSVVVSLENICLDDCIPDGKHAWSGIGRPNLNSLTLDFSNALECHYKQPSDYWAEPGVNIVHLAGRGHGKLSDFAEVSEFVDAHPNSSEVKFITEFTQLDVKERVDQTLLLQEMLWG